MMTNPKFKFKSEQIKEKSKINLKRNKKKYDNYIMLNDLIS